MIDLIYKGGFVVLVLYVVLSQLFPFILKLRNGTQLVVPIAAPTNGKAEIETKAREMQAVISKLEYLEKSVDGLVTGMNDNQITISGLAGSMATLTQLVTRHFKPND